MMKGRLLGQEIAISASGNRVAYQRLYEGPAGPTMRCQELYVGTLPVSNAFSSIRIAGRLQLNAANRA
jgi:hypothetical protein